MNAAIALIATLALSISLPATAAEESGYRLAGVRIAVTDIDKSMAFYIQLGMKAGERYNAREQQLSWGDRSQGSDIILYRNDGSGRIQLTPGTASLAFWVPDIQATIKKLKDAGYPEIEEPRDMKKFLILLTKDPDGNSIELAQPVGVTSH
jgi:catechol 2,3-dioxygenase-like lactoylglutathione lyase family enzyme